MASQTFVLPLSVPRTKKGKPWYLNLNSYRNDHNTVLHKVKVAFAAIAIPLIGKARFTGPVRLTYTLFYGANRRIDLSNVCSVADKFFSDCLTAAGAIEDDNASVVREVRYVWGGLDRSDPRIEVCVEEGDPAARDAAFDALLQQIGAVLEADPTIGGLAFGLTYGRPEPSIEPIAGAPAIKTATLTTTVDYGSDAPLS